MDIVTYGALNKKVGEKLSSNQGTQNAGKMLGINNEGEIQPIQVLGGNVSVTETLESGEDYSMVIEEGEPTAVTSVAGKYGTVTLDAGDIEYDEQEVYNSGTVGKEVGDLKSQMDDLTDYEQITLTTGGYIATNGSTTDYTVIVNASYRYAIYDCVPYDMFVIRGTGTDTARLWAFIDNTGNIIKKSEANVNSVNGENVVAPLNATKLVINSSSNRKSERKFSDEGVRKAFDDTGTILEYETWRPSNYNRITLTTNGYIKTNDATTDFNVIANASYRYAIVNCKPMDAFVIRGTGSDGARLWAFTDANGNIIARANPNENSTAGEEIIAPMRSAKLIINTSTSRISEKADAPSTFTNTLLEVTNGNKSYHFNDFTEIVGSDIDGDVISGLATDQNQYKIRIPVNGAFNIRFKFKVTENLLNENQSGIVAKITNGPVETNITATPTPLYQVTETYEKDSSTKTSYFPCFLGGISYLNPVNNRFYDRNLGAQAFSIRYTGENTNVTIQNTGTAMVLSVGGSTVATLSYSTYDTMAKLYEALKSITDFEVDYGEIEGRTPDELAIFPATKLISQYYTPIDGVQSSTKVEYYDAAPLFVPYAVCDEWKQAEIVSFDDAYIYFVCDGIARKKQMYASNVDKTEFVFGGDCKVLFKDITITMGYTGDTEIANDQRCISSVSPYIVIFEGHGMENDITAGTYEDYMSCSADRLQYISDYMHGLGYEAVSIGDILDYYAHNRILPKRCYTIIFDDYRFDNYLNLKNRSVFTRNGIKPALAVITDLDETITYNGNQITMEKAVSIGKNAGFTCASHTRNHRSVISVKPSEYIAQARADIYDGDEKGIDPNVLIYPYGDTNLYMIETLKWVGLKGAVYIDADTAYSNVAASNKYMLTRIDIGQRTALSRIKAKVY